MGRFFLGVTAVALASYAAVMMMGCDDHDHYGYDANEIVFGIRQTTDAAGAKHVTAGYEFLGLAKRGGSVAQVFRDGDGEGTCYFEQLDRRLGRPRVEGGVATFAGARLPSPGLQILANQPAESTFEGAGWFTGEILTFDADGFAMPNIRAVEMRVPRVDLEGTAIVPAIAAGATELSLKPSDDVGVTWTPASEDDRSRVMIVLETDDANGAGSHVRCFGSGRSGSAIIPARWVARLFSSVDPAAPIKGHLAISSHRQVTIRARGDWLVYVVATVLHSEQAFTGVR